MVKAELIVFFISLILLILDRCAEIKRLKKEIERIERSRERWEDYYRRCIDKLHHRIDELTRNWMERE